MQTNAMPLHGPCDLALDNLALRAPEADDLGVDVRHSGSSTGTGKRRGYDQKNAKPTASLEVIYDDA